MSDCPNPRHRSIYSVLKARISSVFSKIPYWFARDVIIPFLVTRLALLLVARLGFSLIPLPIAFPSAWEIGVDGNRHAAVNHVSATTHPWINTLSRWDAGWYVEIARDCYHYEPAMPSNAAFFPLYPLLIRATHALLFLPNNDYWWLLSGIVVSNIALLVALGYFRSLLAIDVDQKTASRAIIYLLIFPTTFFFSSVYSESLFLALTVAAFYYGRRNRWLTACILTALATLTRSQGIVVLLPLLIEYLAQRTFRLQQISWNATAFALVPAALFAFVLFLKLTFGSWTIMFDIQNAWGRHPMWPWHPMAWLVRHAPPLSAEHHDKLDFCFLLLLPVAGIFGIRQLRLSYSFYLWTAALFFSCWGIYGSIPRFDLVIFPLFLVFALIGIRSRTFHLGYCILCSMLAALFMVMHSQWNWVA
jgi:mannosyltransferase PIG-V